MPAALRPSELRWDIPSAAAIEALFSEPLPGGLRTGAPHWTSHRDLYFDTAALDLRRREVSCRLRYDLRDHRSLTLTAPGMDRAAARADRASAGPDRASAGPEQLGVTNGYRLAPYRCSQGPGPRPAIQSARWTRRSRAHPLAGFWTAVTGWSP